MEEGTRAHARSYAHADPRGGFGGRRCCRGEREGRAARGSGIMLAQQKCPPLDGASHDMGLTESP